MKRSWIKPRNANRVKSFLLILIFSSASLYFFYRYFRVRSGVDDSLAIRQFSADVNELCHSDPDINFHAYPVQHVSSENCYGIDIENNNNNDTASKLRHSLRPQAIELPSVSSSVLRRCRENPYHAFYDCLWPLIHYLSTCVPQKSAPHYTLIVRNGNSNSSNDSNHFSPDSSTIGFENDRSWLEGALDSIIQGLAQLNIGIEILQISSISSAAPVCFASVVRFRPDANWRPLRYNAKFSANATMPHPDRIKAAGLKLFRKLAISSMPQEPAPSENDKKRIIVYDRGDARRRRWTNGFDFAWKLNTTLGERYDVVYLWKMPRTFLEQVEVHTGAVALVAPHGASFANSLFMPPDAVLLEIASRNCNETETEDNNISMEMDEKREDGWTVWHAAKLDMNYVAVGCRIAQERGMAIKTDNDALLKITTALLRVKEEALGFGIKHS